MLLLLCVAVVVCYGWCVMVVVCCGCCALRLLCVVVVVCYGCCVLLFQCHFCSMHVVITFYAWFLTYWFCLCACLSYLVYVLDTSDHPSTGVLVREAWSELGAMHHQEAMLLYVEELKNVSVLFTVPSSVFQVLLSLPATSVVTVFIIRTLLSRSQLLLLMTMCLLCVLSSLFWGELHRMPHWHSCCSFRCSEFQRS